MAVHAFLPFRARVQRLAMDSPAGTARWFFRLLPISGFLFLPLIGCSDDSLATAPDDVYPSFAQVASAPVVNSLADPGTGVCDDTECTLREAMTFASSGATITFAADLSGTITLGSSLVINKYLNISGPGADQIAVSGGGAYLVFWITGGQSTISGLTIRDGLGWSNGGGGVVVTNSGTAVTLENCVLANNVAGTVSYQQGGAIVVNSGTALTVSSCTLYGNSAPDLGQAIYQIGGSLTIRNSTISGNGFTTAKPAIYKYQGTTSIDHSTITANGGGVQVHTNATTGVSVKASIISGNASFDVSGASVGAFTSGGYNLIGTSATNLNVLPAFAATGDQTGVTDAKLEALALNSPGTTLTHALLETSPAIDAGVCTDLDGATVTTDQRGVGRPQGGSCDIGAYEKDAAGQVGLVVNSLADPGTGGCDATECTLREAVENSTPGAEITFSPGLGGTIELASELQLNWNLTITGPGPGTLILDANGTAYANRPALVVWSTASISGLTVTGGYASSSGGGIWNDGDLTLSNVFVTDNVSGSDGGGIFNSGTLTLLNSAVLNNTASGGGGIENEGDLTVHHSTISGNTASSYGMGVGGGIHAGPDAGTTTVRNSTISGNMAYCRGGGIDNMKLIRLEHTTITGNWVTFGDPSSGCGGGGLQSYLDANDAAVGADIVGSIIWGNLGESDVPEDVAANLDAGVFNSLGHNLIGAAGHGVVFSEDFASTGDLTGVSGTEAVLGELALNIPGTTATHALPEGSPAIDAGTCTGLDDSNVTDDQRGVTRPQGSACDIGAYEKEGGGGKATPSVTISNLPENGTVGGGFTPTVVADGDGLTSVTSSTIGICAVDGTTGYVSFIAVGTCTLVAHVTEGTNYVAADGAPQQVAVSSAVLLTPKFTFDLSRLKSPTFGDVPFSVAAKRYVSTNSTGEITFGVGLGSVGCDVDAAGMVTITGAAMGESYCVIEASLAPALPYEGAGPVVQSFHIAKAAATVSIANLPAAPEVGGSFTPELITSSDGLTTVVSTTPAVCLVSGGDVSYEAAGICTLVAHVDEGTNWLAADGFPQTFQVGGEAPDFSSSCTFSVNDKNGQSDITVNWANADPGVTSILVTDGRDLTKQLAPTPTGSWTARLKSIPTGYSLWGGDGRGESTVPLVEAGACVQTGQN